ncbi:MAG: hypothetical protein P857_380 [Candidatus Xenolissoclinum pacificiensis L6]|uniref:Uncharacterized protein n=1 Tax=Candidatus Xenolissoclinum pacificiensis L6 TaxID=1401685 RepID=W2V025_9RICK|nr:MAG: hypothetical protein P857_380 [Candidatus Xenolissoclinum pacificiensis L6]
MNENSRNDLLFLKANKLFKISFAPDKTLNILSQELSEM